MHMSDQEKLTHAGCSILRKRRKLMMIEERHRRDSWFLHSQYETVSEFDTAYEQLMLNEKHLRADK